MKDAGQEGCRTRGIQDRGCRIGLMEESRIQDIWKCRTGEIKDRWDAGQGGIRTGRIQERRNLGLWGIQKRRDIGKKSAGQ